jgi:phosphohistidine phosphatase
LINSADELGLAMKYLNLLQHAKSSWKDSDLDDFDRPLSRRGKASAPLIGARLAALDHSPDVIISSPAVRARSTAALVAAELHVDEHALILDARIYEADCATLITLVRGLRNDWQDVMLVGHNPGLTELANLLAPCQIDNIVTCGVVRLEFPVDSWLDVGGMSGRLQFYDHPKKS